MLASISKFHFDYEGFFSVKVTLYSQKFSKSQIRETLCSRKISFPQIRESLCCKFRDFFDLAKLSARESLYFLKYDTLVINSKTFCIDLSVPLEFLMSKEVFLGWHIKR